MQNFDINIINRRMEHHANASGYDQLIKYLDANVITTNRDLNLPQRALARICRSKIKRSYSTWYHSTNFITEAKAALKWITKKNQVFHFLYGENSYRYLGDLKAMNRNNRIICTYHTPPTRFNELITQNNFLQSLDAIIVVSTNQYELFAELIGPERVHFVPHGIDTNYFQPVTNKINNNSLKCISVGNHLRDFQTLANTANLLSETNIQFIVVAATEHHHYFKNVNNIQLHSSIDDDELLSLFRSADVLFLPLLDCTANNALLEGMSCGLPIISTDLKGVTDYVDNECSILAPKGDADSLKDAICTLNENKEMLLKFGDSSRKRALELNWPNIAIKIQNVYKTVASQ